MSKVWSYIKKIAEGADGSLSLRRIIAIVLVWLIVHLTVKEKIQNETQLYALYSIELTMMLLISVITADNLLTFFKGQNDKK